MNRVNISIITRNLPWRNLSCEICRPWSLNTRERKGTGLRRFASISRGGLERESYDVRCGSSGKINVEIYNAEALLNPLAPLILYFPSTGAHNKDEHPPIPKFLSNLPFQSALAQINYRWNIPPLSNSASEIGDKICLPSRPLSSAVGYANHPFPIPLHDTLFAYDFLTTTYLPNFHPAQTSDLAPRKPPPRPLILSGTFLGGTLATSLALTSTYASSSKTKSYKIVGLITEDAVFDWSDIAVSQPHPKSQAEGQWGWTEEYLHALKKQLFTSPQIAFDTFASPLLFFRTAGFIAPKVWAGEEVNPTPEINRYSTSIETSIEEEEEVSNSYGEIIGTDEEAITSKPLYDEMIELGKETTPVEPEEKIDLGPQTQRISYLKFPPTSSPSTSSSFSRYANANPNSELPQLVIPHSLFLYSSTNTKTSGPGNGEGNAAGETIVGKSKRKKKTVKEAMEEGITPETQANEMARVMRRSILLIECKDRGMWDEGFDANGVAGERVRVLGLVGEDGGGDGGADERVKEWIEDALG